MRIKSRNPIRGRFGDWIHGLDFNGGGLSDGGPEYGR